MAKPPLYSNVPGVGIVAINASDTVNLTNGVCRGLLVGTSGYATVIDALGQVATGIPLQQGYNPICIQRLYATGLSAANIWALY